MFVDIVEDAPPEPSCEPEPTPAPPPPAITFEPQRFVTTLTQACLRYALRLDNPADEAIGPLSITVTLLSPDAPDATAGEAGIHRLILLHAGGTAQVAGEVRLPLGAVTPVVLADMRLFVPLLRVEVEARRVGDLAILPPVTTQAEFLVGAAQGGDGLAPFRLDDGPITANALAAHRQS
jgi:hypothetical protein